MIGRKMYKISRAGAFFGVVSKNSHLAVVLVVQEGAHLADGRAGLETFYGAFVKKAEKAR